MPCDSRGDAIVPGMPYAIGRGTKKIISETRYDSDSDVILVRRKGSHDPWCRVDEIDDSLIWTPVDAYGLELSDGDTNRGLQSPSPVDPRESIRLAVLKAKAHRDQIDAIEYELAIDLGAHGDSELMDAIQQAVQGDGSVDTILQLVEAS